MRPGLVAVALALVALAAPASAGRSDRKAAEAEVRTLVETSLPPDLELVSLTAPADLGTDDIEVRWKAAPKAGRTRVLVLTGPANARRSRWVALELARKVTVTVVVRPVAAGKILTAADLSAEQRAVSGALALDVSALVGLRVRKPLAAGAVLTESDVELGPPLARGTEVSVVIRQGAMSLTTRGRLESAARIGDEVRVRVEATRRILSGRLTGNGTVAVASSASSASSGGPSR